MKRMNNIKISFVDKNCTFLNFIIILHKIFIINIITTKFKNKTKQKNKTTKYLVVYLFLVLRN